MISAGAVIPAVATAMRKAEKIKHIRQYLVFSFIDPITNLQGQMLCQGEFSPRPRKLGHEG
jgi:hypothetical protein